MLQVISPTALEVLFMSVAWPRHHAQHELCRWICPLRCTTWVSSKRGAKRHPHVTSLGHSKLLDAKMHAFKKIKKQHRDVWRCLEEASSS